MTPNLELMAMRWLWLDRNCHYVLRELSPRYSLGKPDVLGVTKDRYLTEIEIKRSVSDFRSDSRKWCRRNRDLNLKSMPKQFYYLMPSTLADKLVSEIPDWAGLVRPSAQVHHLSYTSYNRYGFSFPVECVGVCMSCHGKLGSQ
jgi:hypothetical protein